MSERRQTYNEERRQSNTEDRRRSYIDRQTGEFLFLEWNNQRGGWVPAMPTMQRWQNGGLRVYQPRGRPNTFITLPGFVYWPHITSEEETEIRQVLAYPWIPDGQAIENLTTDQIYDMETYIHQLATDTPSSSVRLFEEALRPTLFMDLPLTLVTVSAAPPHQSQQPNQNQNQRPLPFPRHLTEAVLAKAESDGHVCPITMETINKADAYITSCGHIFQQAAIRNWFQTHSTCPECRQPCQ
jgi:hypothetical protein